MIDKRGRLNKNDIVLFSVFSGLLAIFLIVFACYTFITPASTFAVNDPSANAATEVDLEIDPVISLEVFDSTGLNNTDEINLDITPTDAGTFAKDHVIARVDTNNESGYYLMFALDDSYLSNQGIDVIPSIETDVTEAEFSTASSAHKDRWGFSYSWSENIAGESYAGGDLSLYHPVLPEYFDEPLIIREDVESPVRNSSTNIGVGVNISTAKLPGTYQNYTTIIAMGNLDPRYFAVNFDANADDVTGDVPEAMTAYAKATYKSFTMPVANLTRPGGYELVGWSESPTAEIGDGSGRNGLYLPGDTIWADYGYENEADLVPQTYYAVWDKTGHIHYDANGTGVVGTMDDQTIVFHTGSERDIDENKIYSGSRELTLFSPNFARPGYGFIGWNTEADGSGKMFGPNETLFSFNRSGFSATLTSQIREDLISENGLVLYAQWVASAGDMQNWDGCSAMDIGDVTALTDNRADSININKTYAVAKLVGGKCWMIENLRYTGAGESMTNWCNNAKDASCQATKEYNYGNIASDDSTRSPIANDEGGNRWFSYGNYYSWSAAVGSDTDYSQYAGNVTESICPEGWRLPTNRHVFQSGVTDIKGLEEGLYVNGMSGFAEYHAYMVYPNNFVLSGSYSSGWRYKGWPIKPNNRGENGTYLTAQSDKEYVTTLTLNPNPLVNGNFSADKVDGYVVRCVID